MGLPLSLLNVRLHYGLSFIFFQSSPTRGKDHTDTLSNYKQPYEAYTTDGTHYDLRQVEVQKEEESRAKKL